MHVFWRLDWENAEISFCFVQLYAPSHIAHRHAGPLHSFHKHGVGSTEVRTSPSPFIPTFLKLNKGSTSFVYVERISIWLFHMSFEQMSVSKVCAVIQPVMRVGST